MKLIQILRERGGFSGLPGWDNGNDWSSRGGWVENEEKVKQTELIKFFMDNEHPTDTEVHTFAEDNDMDPAEFEERVYKLLHSLLKKGVDVGSNDEEKEERY